MTTARAEYKKIDAEFWNIIDAINELDNRRNALDVDHFRDADYAERRAELDAQREELVTRSREVGARRDHAKKVISETSPAFALHRQLMGALKK